MATSLTPWPLFKAFDNNGAPLSSGLLYTYQAGTSTKAATYTDSTGNTPNANPVVLNARGEASVWLQPNTAYKFVLSPSGDTDPPTNPIWSQDQISNQIVATSTGSFNITSSDFTSPLVITTNYTQTNNLVTLTVPQAVSATGTSNNSNLTFSGIPAFLQPLYPKPVMCPVVSGNSQNPGWCVVGTSGNLVFYSGIGNLAVVNQFSNVSIKGLYNTAMAWSITYNLI